MKFEVEIDEPIKENIEFRIAKKTIECWLVAFTHPLHKDEIILEWKIDPNWNPCFMRIHKSKIPALIERMKVLQDE